MTEEHCVNCGQNLEGDQRYALEPEETVIAVMKQWVAPKQVSSENLVCYNCWVVLSESIVTPKQEEKPAKKITNIYTCVNCHCTLRRIRKHLLNTKTVTESIIRNIVIGWVQPREVTLQSWICHLCWLKARRECLHKKNSQKNVLNTVANTKAVITLPSYKRASNTSRHCIFRDCNKGERKLFPRSIRVKLLCDFSFYVPPSCRICNYHLNNSDWDSLIAENDSHTFTSAYMEDFTSLLKSPMENKIDFENIDASDDNLVFYFLGMSKTQFKEILEKYPKLKKIHRGATGLAGHLTKLKTGDSDERLAALFNISRTTFNRLMKIAKQIITQESTNDTQS